MNGSRVAAMVEAFLTMAPVGLLAAFGAVWAGFYFLDALLHVRINLLLVSTTCKTGLVGIIGGWCLLGRYILL